MTLEEVMIEYFNDLWPGLKDYPQEYKLKVMNNDPNLLRNSKILKLLKDKTQETLEDVRSKDEK